MREKEQIDQKKKDRKNEEEERGEKEKNFCGEQVM